TKGASSIANSTSSTTTVTAADRKETTNVAVNATPNESTRTTSNQQKNQNNPERASTEPQQTSAPRVSTSKTESAQQTAAKQPSMLHNWFKQKNFINTAPGEIIDDTIKYFQVTMAPARVLTYLSPEAPILGMAKKGDHLQLIGEGDSWCRVVFADTLGWIERKNGRIVDAPKSLIASDLFLTAIIVGIFVLIAGGLFVAVRLTRKKNSITTDVSIQKNVMIIAKSNKVIDYTLTDTTTTIDRCFSEIGFKIYQVRDNASLQKTIDTIPLDIILIDWKFDRNIIPTLEKIYATRPDAGKLLFIVYNVPDPTAMQAGQVLPMMYFLGLTFSDRDIFKLVTPLIISENAKKTRQSTQSSALEGNIADGNLLEVLQFIEIGSKTGCLLIQTDHPYGLIYFMNGRIVYAATAQEITGRDAIFKMLDQKKGTFRFILNRKPKTSNVNLSTLEVLMEWTKAVDEAHGH
ncbi:MAG: DUF4388 domain-containing protein, partial [Fibrobacter sp.]|nr:DUF4388 domain-containing protein [Fibrobacter sp.]